MFTTGYLSKRVYHRVPFVGVYLWRGFSWLCGKLTGHPPGPDWGYGGGAYADSWCRWCDRMTQIPSAKLDGYPDARKHMWGIVGHDIKQGDWTPPRLRKSFRYNLNGEPPQGVRTA